MSIDVVLLLRDLSYIDNSVGVLVSLQDINMRKPFKSSVIKDQQIITLDTRPHAITESYNKCDRPPALAKLNPYRYDYTFSSSDTHIFLYYTQGLF